MKPLKVIGLVLLAISLAQTDQDSDQVLQEATSVYSDADEATPVLNLDTEGTVSTATEQTTTDAISDQSTTMTPAYVDLISSTTDTSHDIDHTTTESAIQSEVVEPSQSVIYVTAQSVTDQSETVTQSTPVDQLEIPLQTDEKSDEEQRLEEPKPEGISGEDVLKVIKSLPEQPNGLHGKDQVSQGLEGLPGVTEMPADLDHKKVSEEDDGLTFNEWTQKELAKGEIEKQISDKEDIPVKPKVSSSKQRKKKNYASSDCGAKVLASNPESTNSKGILNSNKDDYMINPCKVKRWVVIELCEPIQAYSVDIASLELFSSQPKKFKIYLSDRYPTKDWKFAGEKDLTDERVIQSFDISESHDYFAKFVKVELVDHYGDEHFCPLTILKVFGIAVTDYEDNHEESESENIDDEDHVIGGEVEEDSKNLFDSARDTVMTLVKKVLNVDPKDEANNNKTNADNLSGDGPTNESLSLNLNETQPSLPNASIPSEIVKDNDMDISSNQGQGDILPQVPEPGKTDSVSIVTKLEDDEQVETGSTSTDLDQKLITNGTILAKYIQCRRLDLHKHRGKSQCRKMTTFCQFICVVFKTAAKISFISDYRSVTKKDKQKTDPQASQPEENVMAKTEIIDSNDISSSEVSIINQSQDTIEADKFESKSTKTDFTTKVEVQPSVEDTLTGTTVNVVKDTGFDTNKDASTQSIVPSATLEPILQTETSDQSTSTLTMHVPSEPTKAEQTKSDIVESQSDGTTLVDPSQTSVAVDLDISTTSPEQEPTPSLPDSWKPDTKDLMETDSLSATESTMETTNMINTDLASSKDISDTPSTSNKQLATGEPTPTSSDLSTETSQEVSSSSVSTASTVPEPSKTVTDVPTAKKPTVGVTGVTDQGGAGSSVEKQDQTTDGKPKDDRQEVKITNTTTADEKTEGQKVKPDRSFDIKVPPMSGTSRESAIMRLSNRIKVLEQNVSLSSRFLEELSKRYKKQSEDMMKLLNKTLAKLSNMTVENEVKNKIHDDEMYAMERRLENLTERVSKLTNSLQVLNQQVTDRQMIATTVEILIILVMFIVLGRRGHKETLTPEIQKLIEAMPPKAKLKLSQRRNSISGTPSKKLSSDLEPGGLNKFPSETSLDLGIVEPSKSLFGNQKLPDGVKKKKKKKQKLPDGRASWTGFETSHTNQSTNVEKSKNLIASLNLQTDPHKKIIAKKKPENTGDWSTPPGGGAIPKKAPPHGGRKREEDSRSVGSPSTARRDKQFQKGHRRQKSLPKQHFSDEEFRATAFKGGQADQFHSDSGTSYQAHSSVYPTHGKSFTKTSSRRYSDNLLTLSDHDSCVGKGKKQLIHNGFSDNSIKETNSRQEIKASKSANSMSTHGKSAFNIDHIGPSFAGAIDTESRNSEQQSAKYFNGFNELGSDIDDVPDVFNEPSPNFSFQESSQQGAINGVICYDDAEDHIAHDLGPERQNGNIDHYDDDSNYSNISERKDYRKLWGLLK